MAEEFARKEAAKKAAVEKEKADAKAAKRKAQEEARDGPRKDNNKQLGFYKSIYSFDAVNFNKECSLESNCAGWSMKGDYRIFTGHTGGTSINVHA